MLGFAIVDWQPSAKAVAIWLTTHVGGTAVQHTNAVVIDRDDERFDEKIHALTADRAVILTGGSNADGRFQHAVGVEILDDLIAETATRQQLIQKAVTDYMAKTKNKNLVVPDFRSPPTRPVGTPPELQLRALAAANYVADVWSGWLATEEQRTRRAADPRTGSSPWIMPEGLAAPEVSVFPDQFGERVKPEPLKRC